MCAIDRCIDVTIQALKLTVKFKSPCHHVQANMTPISMKNLKINLIGRTQLHSPPASRHEPSVTEIHIPGFLFFLQDQQQLSFKSISYSCLAQILDIRLITTLPVCFHLPSYSETLKCKRFFFFFQVSLFPYT